MNEIGVKLKETRESIGVSIEEAAEDLKIRPAQIEAIEAGNMEEFNDVYNLKYFIRDYAKYLGLDYEDMVDEFNEYLFDYTSKLSLDAIKKAKKEESKEEPNHIASPYTKQPKHRYLLLVVILACIFALVLTLVGYLIYNHQNINIDNTVGTIK